MQRRLSLIIGVIILSVIAAVQRDLPAERAMAETDAFPCLGKPINEDCGTPNMDLRHHYSYKFGTNLAIGNTFLVAGSTVYNNVVDDAVVDDAGFRIFQLTGQATPKQLSFTRCDTRDSFIGLSGNLVVQAVDEYDTSSTRSCGRLPSDNQSDGGVRIWDITDRSRPQYVNFAPLTTPIGAHTLTVVPNEELVYVAPGGIPGESTGDVRDDIPVLPIVDLSAENMQKDVMTVDYVYMANAPKNPDLPPYPQMPSESAIRPAALGCHEIGLDLPRNRAFCAAAFETQIWDISNRKLPKVLSVIKNREIFHHHSAEVSRDGTVLVISDEYVPNLLTGAPSSCLVPNGPLGAIWFYDISEPREPKLLTWWSPPEPFPGLLKICTAHNFAFFDDRDWLAVAWYEHGLFVLDFTDVKKSPVEEPNPVKMRAHYRPATASLSDVKLHRGYIYASSFSPAGPVGLTNPLLEGGGGLYVFSLDKGSP